MRLRACVLAVLGNVLLFSPAYAVAISAVVAATVSTAPFRLGTFGDAGSNGLVSTAPVWLANGVVTFGSNANALRAAVYDGNVSGVAATPIASGNYLVAEPGNDVSFSFTSPQSQFQLLWGSADSYNQLTFLAADGTATTVYGSDITAIDNSIQSAYVTIAGLNPFVKVIASSSSPAFEFQPGVQVPEPGTLMLLGAGLMALAWMRRRRC